MRSVMHTNIEIDDQLLAAAKSATGAKTTREAVELGLETLVRLKQQEQIRGYRGKLRWQDDLERLRRDT